MLHGFQHLRYGERQGPTVIRIGQSKLRPDRIGDGAHKGRPLLISPGRHPAVVGHRDEFREARASAGPAADIIAKSWTGAFRATPPNPGQVGSA